MTESTAPVRELNSKTEEEKVSPINETVVAMLMAVAKERRKFYHPILRDSRNDKILDGHQRLEAYKRLADQGVEVSLTWQDETPKDDDDARKITIEVNSYRRPWNEIEDRRTQSQMLRGLRVPGGRGPGGVPSHQQIADALGVDEKTVRRDLAAAAETAEKSAISAGAGEAAPVGAETPAKAAISAQNRCTTTPSQRPGHEWKIEELREKARQCGISGISGVKLSKARKADILDALEGLITEGEQPPKVTTKPVRKSSSRPSQSGNGHKAQAKPVEVEQKDEANDEKPVETPKKPEKYKNERPRLDRLAKVFHQLEEIHKELDSLCKTRNKDGRGPLAHGPEWHQEVVAYVECCELDSVNGLPDYCKPKERPIVFWMAVELERLGRVTQNKVSAALVNHGYLGICGKEPEHLRFDWTKPKEAVAAPLERGGGS